MHKHIMVKSPRHHNRYEHQEQEVELIYPKPKEKPLYQTMEIRFPPNEEHTLHPLRRQYLENRLNQIEILERQQTMQDKFSTAMYGKKDYSEEKNNILQEMLQGKQSRPIGHQYPDEKFLDIADKQIAQEKYPHTPEAVGKEIARFERENPEDYQSYMKEMEEREKANKKTWQTATLEEWKRKDAEYQQTQPSHCNTALGSLLKEKGIDLPANKSMNDIINFMETSDDWQKIPRTQKGLLDHQTANDLAKKGETVVFGYNNPEGHGHGGMLTGNPTMFESKNFKDNEGHKIAVPEVQGSIGKEEITTKHLGYHITSNKEPHTNYYIYKGNYSKDSQETQKNE